MVPTMRNQTRSLRSMRRGENSSGQALAEMAIILPILLLLVFGIIEMALAWRTSQIVTNVTREGARLAVLPTSTDGDVTARVEEGLTSSGLTASKATITFDCNDEDTGSICAGTGQQTIVQTDYPYQFHLLGPLVELAGSDGDEFGQINISSTSRMRRE